MVVDADGMGGHEGGFLQMTRLLVIGWAFSAILLGASSQAVAAHVVSGAGALPTGESFVIEATDVDGAYGVLLYRRAPGAATVTV